MITLYPLTPCEQALLRQRIGLRVVRARKGLGHALNCEGL